MNANYIAMARDVIKDIFGTDRVSYDTMEDYKYNGKTGYHIAFGMSRETFIRDDLPFVIKTGLSKAGNEQCEKEARLYHSAVVNGVEYAFAEYYGRFRYHNHYFYLFEKVEGVGAYCGEFFDSVDDDDLMDFCYDNGINDLHCENYGYNKNRDCFVICDYAGYYDF